MTKDPQLEPDDAVLADEMELAAEEGEVEILGFEGSSDREEPQTSAPPPTASTPPAEDGAARQLADLQERHLRLRADFDNFRKRMEREREETRRYALSEPLRDLLPVLDNLERAATAQGRLEDLQRGVEMIARQLAETLRRYGLTEVEAMGAPFDPQVHEAVMREESADVRVPTVVGEMQRGYRLHERLLRPAMVRVAVPVEPVAAGDEEPEVDETAPATSGGGTGEAS